MLLQNGAQEARARRCCRGRSEPLPPSTVLLLAIPTTDGAAGTRCLDSRWWVPERVHAPPWDQKINLSDNCMNRPSFLTLEICPNAGLPREPLGLEKFARLNRL